MLLNADSGRYGNLNREITHSTQLGNDDYPKISSSTYELIHRRSGGYDNNDRSHRNTRTGGRGGRGGRNGRALQFIQQSENLPEGCVPVPGRDGTTMEVQCYCCQEWGHLANNCSATNRRPRDNPPSGRSGVGMMQVKCGYSFAQGDDVIPRS